MKTLRISLLVLLTLLLLWLWSRNGILLQARIQRDGKHLTVWLDDRRIAQADLPSSDPGMVSAECRYQDLHGRWFEGQSSAVPTTITLPAGNFDRTIGLRNPFNITLQFQEGSKAFGLNFSPYRHVTTMLLDADHVLQKPLTWRPRIGVLKGIQWILWVLLKPFPIAGIIVLIWGAFYVRSMRRRNPASSSFETRARSMGLDRPRWTHWLLLLSFVLPLVSLSWSRYLMTHYTDEVPHVPDSVSYMLLARMIAGGSFVLRDVDIPSFVPRLDLKDYLHHWFVPYEKVFVSPYLTGHPLVLALGDLFHAMNWVPPLIGSATLLMIFVLTWLITRSISAGLLAQLVCLLSPFFQTQTIDYMSHNTAALYLLISLTALLIDRPSAYILTGLFAGLLMNTRPLTFAFSAGVIALAEVARLGLARNWKVFFWRIGYGCAGFLAPLVLFMVYNHATTGKPLTTPYIYHGILRRVGFGDEFTIGYGLLHGFSNIAVFSLFFLRNYYVSFLPLLLCILVLPLCKGRRFHLLLLLAIAFCIFAAWIFYDGNFFMYGPRFIYEALPILAVLYGATIFYLFKLVSSRLSRILLATCLVVWIGNILVFELQWLGFREPEYGGIVFVPSSISELKTFNAVDGRFAQIARKRQGKADIYLMKVTPNWWGTGGGIFLNTFPLVRSSPLFLTLPPNYKNEIPRARMIDWDKMPKGLGPHVRP